MTRQFYVYLMASTARTLYVGTTNDLRRRVGQHKQKLIEGFTSRYDVTHLVHFEVTSDIRSALAREKRIKAWRRSKKVELIEASNPGWVDLSDEWGQIDR